MLLKTVLTIALTFIQSTLQHAAAAEKCPRPRDFSNRVEAEKYDACVLKEGYVRPAGDPAIAEKTSCLHVTKDVITCRRKELRGESIKTIESRVGAPLKPLDGSVPLGGKDPGTKDEKNPGTPPPNPQTPPSTPAPQSDDSSGSAVEIPDDTSGDDGS